LACCRIHFWLDERADTAPENKMIQGIHYVSFSEDSTKFASSLGKSQRMTTITDYRIEYWLIYS
jgi:hypothetical protein